MVIIFLRRYLFKRFGHNSPAVRNDLALKSRMQRSH